MLVRLTPDQVAEFWRMLRPGVRSVAPPQISISEEAIKNVLKNLIDGKGTVWLYCEEDYSAVYGMAVTTPIIDNLTETGNLLIWGLYSYGGLETEMIEEGLNGIKKYAQNQGYGSVVTYSKNEKLIRYLSSIGAETEFSFITYS